MKINKKNIINNFYNSELAKIKDEEYTEIVELVYNLMPERLKYKILISVAFAINSYGLLSQKDMSIRKMRTVLFPKTEKLKNILKDKDSLDNSSQTDLNKKEEEKERSWEKFYR